MEDNTKINVLLIDDHPIVLNGLKNLINDISEIEIVGEAENGKDAISKYKINEFDLIISDISMPEMDGIELTKYVKRYFPEVKILLLTAYNEISILKNALFSGAEGCLLKNSSKKEIFEAILKIMDNGYYYCDNILEIARNLQHESEPIPEIHEVLSKRELDVLKLLLQGYANKNVAEKLNISFHTVCVHRKNIMKKTNSCNISGLFNYAKTNKLFPEYFSI